MDKYVYCLEEGLCALHSVSPGGRERIYQYFPPGDFVGFIPAYARTYPDDTFYAFFHHGQIRLHTLSDPLFYPSGNL